MKKNSKKALATTMCTVMMLGAVAPIVSAKAEIAPAGVVARSEGESVAPGYITWDESVEDYLSGVLNVNNAFNVTSKLEDSKLSGNIKFKISVNDLFHDAKEKFYEKYSNRETIVMYSENGTAPHMTYTIKFPEGVNINKDAINYTFNTAGVTLDKNNTKFENGTLTMVFNLSWQDYKGFFNTVSKEFNDNNKFVSIDIPYEKNEASSSDEIIATGSGHCSLWYWGRWTFLRRELVKITTPEKEFILNPLESNISL